MTMNEVMCLTRWAHELGIKTVGELADIKKRYAFKDNSHFINYVNACFVFGYII